MAMRRAIFMSFSFSDGASHSSWCRTLPHLGDAFKLSGDTRSGDNGEMMLRRMT